MINRVRSAEDLVPVEHVLISVADKRGLDRLVPGLVKQNPRVRFYSTGGTYAAIAEILGDSARENLISVSDYTGQPEMQGGLVKTLDFKIYLGLLSESHNEAHLNDLERVQGVAFNLVVVNLYPFSRAVAEPDVTCEAARAHIDIGGPCMLRAAAKNFLRVAAVCNPEDYGAILDELSDHGGATTFRRRFELARRAFAHTAEYDAAISGYLAGLSPDDVAGSYEMETQ